MAGSFVWQKVDSVPVPAGGYTGLGLVNIGCGDMLAFASAPGFDGLTGIGGAQPYSTKIYRSRDRGNSWALRASWAPMEWYMSQSRAWSTGRLGEAAIGTFGPDRNGPIEPGLGIALTRDQGNSYGPVIARGLFAGGLPSASGPADGLIDSINVYDGARMAGSDTQISVGWAQDNNAEYSVILRSTDAGLSFTEAIPVDSSTTTFTEIEGIIGIPPDIWISGYTPISGSINATRGPSVVRSSDDGKSWARIRADAPVGKAWTGGSITTITYVGSGVVLAGGNATTTPSTTGNYRFFRSTDSGLTWTAFARSVLPGTLTGFSKVNALLSLGSNVVLMGADYQGTVTAHRPFWFSEDGGVTWSNANTYAPSVTNPHKFTPEQMVLADDGAVIAFGPNGVNGTLEWWRGTYSTGPASGLAGGLNVCSDAFFSTPPAQESCA